MKSSGELLYSRYPKQDAGPSSKMPMWNLILAVGVTYYIIITTFTNGFIFQYLLG
jgi:hypothetical protein